MSESSAGETVVLIHGLWMTPRSWEQWIPYCERRGYRVLAPGYPGFDIEVEALRASPSIIAELTVPETVEHLARIVDALDRPPIIIGHSFGGTLTQLLLARGMGACGIAIDSAPTEGVYVNPPSQLKSLFPILKNPLKHADAVGFTPEEFHYAFTNTLSAAESRAVYERYHIPAPAKWVWAYGVFANLTPGPQETWVDYEQADRAPLLFIAGGADHIMPPSVNRSNAKHYTRAAITDYHEFEGRSHWTCAEPGWEEVADFALSWCESHVPSLTLPASGEGA